MENLSVILLAAGERTESAAKALVKDQVPEDQIFVIRKEPLWQALKDFYTLALELGRPWTLRLDADVLLGRTALADMMEELGKLPDEAMGYQATFLDKLTGTARRCGQKTYRLDSLPIFLEAIDKNREHLNPEQPVIHGALEGRWVKNFHQVLGLHDVEQYYVDIYRKAFLFAYKQLPRCKEMIPYWREESEDADFRVALKGVADGIRHLGPVRFDRSFFPARIEGILHEMGLEEKPSLQQLGFDRVAEMMRDFRFNKSFNEFLKSAAFPLDYSR